MKPRVVFVFLLVLAALRCGWVAVNALAPQEAYFWMCAERMAPAFFDGPPGTALLIRAFELFGTPALTGARLAWPLLALAAGWLAWSLARAVYDESVAAWTAVALNALPVFNIGAVTVGPAMPALVLVLAGARLARPAWEGRRIFWGAAGACFALAIIFRYESILVPVGLLVIALSSPRHRTSGDLAGLGVMGFLAALALWGPLTWNASLEWIPMAGGTLRTAWAFQPLGFLVRVREFLGAFSVPAGLALLAGVVWMVRESRQHGRPKFLLALCGALWLWWLYSSLRGGDAGTSALLGAVPASIFVLASCRKFSRASSAAAVVVLIAFASSGWVLWNASRERGSWQALAREFQSAVREIPAGEKEGFFIAENPDLAAAMGFYLGGGRTGSAPAVFIPESPDLSSQFGIWPSYADFVESTQIADEYFTEQKGINPFVGRSALFLGTDLPQTIGGAFGSVAPLRRVQLSDGRVFTIFLCLDYQTLPL